MNTVVSACSHCGLPLGCLGRQKEVNGVPLDFCCYGCSLAYQVEHGASEEPEAAALLIRLGVGAFLAMNIMLFSLLQYANAFASSPELAAYVPWLLWALATPLLIIIGGPFIGSAWLAAREGRLGADALITMATLSAYGFSAWQVLIGSTHVYFDTATMVLMLFTLGRYLEAQARAHTARSLAPILAAERAQVRTVMGESEIVKPVNEVTPGDVVRILPGERIAIDGVIIAGHSICDETILTGQSQPQSRQPGMSVHAGSINGEGQLLVRASVSAGATRWISISRRVRAALARKSGVAETIDRVAAWFVPVVLVIATATFWFWSQHGELDHALLTGMAVLVVACPCSLGLAAPLATTLGLSRAAHRGILIRGGAVLERLTGVRGMAFDKTGTLTQGTMRPIALHVHDTSAAEALSRAKALAQASTHPLARAIAALEVEGPAVVARDVHASPGAGIMGQINGVTCALGSSLFMANLGWSMPAPLGNTDGESRNGTAVYLGWRSQVRARIDLLDTVRPESMGVIAELKARGLQTLVLSGDSHEEVKRVAAALGINEWHAELVPETKVSILHRWQEQNGALAMVGDEMNDGPVLAVARVGIAVGGASDLAKESADIMLPPGIASLPWLLDLALEVRRSTRANLAWSFGYNAVALALAASGHLQPVIAAVLMAGSSLLVVMRSMRANSRAAQKDVADRRGQ